MAKNGPQKGLLAQSLRGTAIQIVDNLQYACGLKRIPALTLNQNPLSVTVFYLTGYEYEK
jgi:hypothetical protein